MVPLFYDKVEAGEGELVSGLCGEFNQQYFENNFEEVGSKFFIHSIFNYIIDGLLNRNICKSRFSI